MKIVIFAGGTGTRFWPASRRNSPKQFLPVGGDEPLLVKAYKRVSAEFSTEDIYISTGKKYESEVRSLLPDLPVNNLFLEAPMRDTGPAVTLAMTYLSKIDPNEPVAILWSDHIVKYEDVFREGLQAAAAKTTETGKAILMTVPVRYPSPHRGYISHGELVEQISESIQIYEFNQFTEKPSVEKAEEFIKAGHYTWNVGYWILTPAKFLEVTARKRPEYISVTQEIVDSSWGEGSEEKYESLEKISADYTFAEHLTPDDALCMKAEIGWSDVGEWIALKEAVQVSDEANVIEGNVEPMDCEDCIVYNYDPEKLVAPIGLKGMVVVNTKDAVAVFSKQDNTKLRAYIKQLEANGLERYL